MWIKVFMLTWGDIYRAKTYVEKLTGDVVTAKH